MVWSWLLTLVHVVVSVFLVLVVLLQTGKRADLAGAFGGGGSQTAFGARGAATVLAKATTAAAVVFMVTSLALSILSSRSTDSPGSALDSVDPAQIEESAPPTPQPVPADPSSTGEEPEAPPAEADPDAETGP